MGRNRENNTEREGRLLLTVFYKVFNEADYLKESIKSIYDYADRIVFLEYCLESMRQVILPTRATKWGLSVDGTTNIIANYPDPDKKIEHRKIGFLPGHESIPYQMTVDMTEVGEYIWVLDGDIVYPEQLCENIRRWVNSGQYDCIWIPERVFYHDLWHEKHLFFTHHQRVFKNPHKSAFYFPGCFEVHWLAERAGVSDKWLFFYGRDEEFEQWGQKYRAKICDADKEGFAYHYSYARDTQKILEKLLWQYVMIDRRWDNQRERQACLKFGNDALLFKLMSHDFFLNHEPQDRSDFVGVHPKVMRDNKWMDYRWDEKPIKMKYGEARKLISNPGGC